MAKFPGPVKGDEAEAAEKRLKRLHQRFRAVSRSAGQARHRRAAGEITVSPFEVAIILGVAMFVVWAIGRGFGAW